MKARLGLLIFGVLAGSALMSSAASAEVDPDCDGSPYSNEPAIHDFRVATPDSRAVHAVSGVNIAFLLCGSEVVAGGVGAETLYNHVDIQLPSGVGAAATDQIEPESFAGLNTVNLLAYTATSAVGPEGVLGYWRVQGAQRCRDERDTRIVGPTPSGTIVGCYQEDHTPFGIFSRYLAWVTRDPGGQLHLTLGPMYWYLSPNAGLTRLDARLCGYFGTGTQFHCGAVPQIEWRNGAASFPNCAEGRGLYTATATMNSGAVTPPASACVEWVPGLAPSGTEPGGPQSSREAEPR